MKCKWMLCGLPFLLAATVAHAVPVLTVGVPGDSLLSTPTKPSPNLGTSTLLNFDALVPYASYSTYSSGGVSISSPEGLVVYPFSTQSGPNELYDNSALGSASILITSATAVAEIGVGIADSDAVNVVFQAIGAGGRQPWPGLFRKPCFHGKPDQYRQRLLHRGRWNGRHLRPPHHPGSQQR